MAKLKIKQVRTKAGVTFIVGGIVFRTYAEAQKHLVTVANAPPVIPVPPPPTRCASCGSLLYKGNCSNIFCFYLLHYKMAFRASLDMVVDASYSDPDEEKEIQKQMANIKTKLFAVMDDVEPKVFRALVMNFDNRTFDCPFCSTTVIEWEEIEKFTADADAFLRNIKLRGRFCSGCDAPIGVGRWEGDELVAKCYRNKKSKAFELWYVWEDFWFEATRDADNNWNCPICDSEFKITSKFCTTCKAQQIPQPVLQRQLYFPTYEEAVINISSSNYKGYWLGNWREREMAREPSKNSKGQWIAKASINWTPSAGVYTLQFDFTTKEFIELLKMIIPSSDRSYDPKTKSWFVSESHFDDLKLLFESKFTNVKTTTKAQVEEHFKGFENNFARPVDTNKELTTFLNYVQEAGIPFDRDSKDGALAQKAYRRAAMYFHPDRNPARAKDMSALNEAFNNLKEYFGLVPKTE